MNAAPPETEYAFWTVPETSFTITYALGVFHEIDFQVNEGYRRIPHGGIEIGGLLFGHTDADAVRVEAFRTIECEHASGPSFVLSERDLTRLREQLSTAKDDPELAGLDAVGWFVAHTRNPLRMLDREAVLFDELFAEPGRILVLIKPERFQPTRFSFLVRSADGSVWRDAAEHAVILPLPGRVTRSGNGPVPSIPAPEQKPAGPPIRQPPPVAVAVEPVAPPAPPGIEAAAREEALPSAPVPEEATPLPIPEPVFTEEPQPIPEPVMAEAPEPVLVAEPELLLPVVVEKQLLPAAEAAPEQVEEVAPLLEPEPEPEFVSEPLLLQAAQPDAAVTEMETPAALETLAATERPAADLPRVEIEEPATEVAAAEIEPAAPELAPDSEPAIPESAAADVAPHVPEGAPAELAPPTEIAAPPPEVAVLAPEVPATLKPAASAEPSITESRAAPPEALPSIEEIKRRRSAKQGVEPTVAPQYAYELSRQGMHPGLRLAAVLSLAAALGCGVGYWAYRQLPVATITLNVQPQPPALVVSWPPEQTRDAKFAAIRVDDGQQIALTPEQKEAGQTKITATGDNIKVELFAQHWIRDSRGLIRYVKAAPPSEANIQ